LRRTVAALVKFTPPSNETSYHILRWYDTVVGQASWPVLPDVH
jgi:hypothetical protein